MRPLQLLAGVLVLGGAAAVPAVAASGNFSISAGLTYATVQTTTISVGGGSASTSTSSTNVTGTALGAEYLVSPSPKGRLSLGPSVLLWNLPGADSVPSTSSTSLGVCGSYKVSDAGSLRLVVANQVRFGYTQSFGQGGLYAIGEVVAAHKDQVDSFGYVGIGYLFK